MPGGGSNKANKKAKKAAAHAPGATKLYASPFQLQKAQSIAPMEFTRRPS